MTNEAMERNILLYDPNAPKELPFHPPKAPHPWRRYFARALDFSIMNLLLQFILSFFMTNITHTHTALDVALTWVAWVFLVLLEPLFLSRWGTTPGKFLMGITVHDKNGDLLTRSAAFDRTVQVFAKGEGYCIPFYNLYRNYKCYRICEEEGVMPWDANIIYTVKPMKARYAAGYLAAEALMTLAIAAIVLFQAAPPHTGKLTAEQFTENYNHLLDYHAMDGMPRLSSEGKWVEDSREYSFTFDIFEDYVSLPQFEEEKGILRSFTYSVSSEGPIMTAPPRNILLTEALLASETNFIPLLEHMKGTIDPSNSMDTIPILQYMEKHPFESFTMTTGKLRIIQTVEMENFYIVHDGDYLFAENDDLPAHCTITLTLEQLP